MANAWPMIERCKLAQWRAVSWMDWDEKWKTGHVGDGETYDCEHAIWSAGSMILLSLKESRSSQTESE